MGTRNLVEKADPLIRVGVELEWLVSCTENRGLAGQILDENRIMYHSLRYVLFLMAIAEPKLENPPIRPYSRAFRTITDVLNCR